MTKQEILEGNKLIAEFMQVEIKENFHKLFYYSDQPFYYVDGKSREEVLDKASSYFKYHLSWDWLIGVIDKIESKGFCVFTFRNCIWIKENNTISSKTLFKQDDNDKSKIENYYLCVLNFIEWYNSQKEK